MSASTVTFTYGSLQAGTTSSYLWSIGSNWNTGSVPNSSQFVEILASASISVDDEATQTIAGLQVDASRTGGHGHLQILGNETLAVSGNVTGLGTIDLVGNSAVLQIGSSLAGPAVFFDNSSSGQEIVFLGNVSGQTDSNTISGFTGADAIDFRDFSSITAVNPSGAAGIAISGSLVGGGAATYTFNNFAPGTGAFGGFSTTSDGHGGTLLEATCFAAGTRLLTDLGERLVEDLTEGDLLVSATDGSLLPVRWVGRTRVNVAAARAISSVAPIRIRADAIGDRLPHRDLVLSPEHCLYIDGRLIAAKCLVNGMTIVQERDQPAVTYFHVETDRHAVILSEGLASETYLDTGNRAVFEGAGTAAILRPEFHINFALKQWQVDACAPLATLPAEIEPVWRRVRARAEALGYRAPRFSTTVDPAIRVMADGVELMEVCSNPGVLSFVLPRGAGDLAIMSRSGSPADSAPYLNDHRQLGISVVRLVTRTGTTERIILPDDRAFISGWHPVEVVPDQAPWRWSDGCGRVRLGAYGMLTTLDIFYQGGVSFVVPEDPALSLERAA